MLTSRLLLYLDTLLLLYFTKLSVFFCLAKFLLIGVGAQIWPGGASWMSGFRGDDVLIFSTTLENGINYNPDFPTYVEPFAAYAQCLSLKAKKADSLQNTEGLLSFIRPSCLCIFPTIYRLPGYGMWFVWWRADWSHKGWYFVLLLLHTFWASLAALAFWDLVRGFVRSISIGFIAMLIYAFFPFSLRYEWIMGSESMNYSFITLFIWSYWRSQGEHLGWLFLSGLLLLEATLIRPITFAIFLPAVIFLLLRRHRRWQRTLFFLFPLLIFQTYWQTCNLYLRCRMYLLSETLYYKGIEYSEWGAVNFLLGSFGDNFYWFYSPRYKFPRRAFTSEFGPQAEISIDSIYRGYFAGQISETQAAAYANAWRESIRREKKFLYYVGSRFYAAMNFWTSHLQENFYYTDALRAGIVYLVAYGISSIFWLVAVVGGLLASLYYLWHWKRYPFLAFLAVSANIAWGSYVLLLQIQSRYFLFPLAFLLPISLIFLCEKLLKRPLYVD